MCSNFQIFGRNFMFSAYADIWEDNGAHLGQNGWQMQMKISEISEPYNRIFPGLISQNFENQIQLVTFLFQSLVQAQYSYCISTSQV